MLRYQYFLKSTLNPFPIDKGVAAGLISFNLIVVDITRCRDVFFLVAYLSGVDNYINCSSLLDLDSNDMYSFKSVFLKISHTINIIAIKNASNKLCVLSVGIVVIKSCGNFL